jgi:phage terminase large subunit-like protein
MNQKHNINEFIENPELIWDFMNFFFNFKIRPYQKEFVLNALTNKKITALWSRQSGKSTIVAAYIAFICLLKPTAVMITAPGLTQSSELFNKIKQFITSSDILDKEIVRVTQTELELVKSRIKALPTGSEGKSMRGFTADIVVEEEAGLINDTINNAVIAPMLASKKNEGQTIKIGTPWKRNHFYSSCYDKDSKYKLIKVTWRECVKEGVYTQEFIDEQRRLLTENQFRTEYECDFIDDDLSMFPLALVEPSMEEYNLIKVY